jgi:hypothetical protein
VRLDNAGLAFGNERNYTSHVMSERRQFPRYIAELSARLSQPPGGTASNATVVNLSIKGCCVEGATLIKANQDCELTMEWEGKQFRAAGVVTWKSSKGEAGLKFLYVDQESQDLLRKICSNLRLLPLSRLPNESK